MMNLQKEIMRVFNERCTEKELTLDEMYWDVYHDISDMDNCSYEDVKKKVISFLNDDRFHRIYKKDLLKKFNERKREVVLSSWIVDTWGDLMGKAYIYCNGKVEIALQARGYVPIICNCVDSAYDHLWEMGYDACLE